MANQYGPRIITDGLTLCLDTAEPNSKYPKPNNNLLDTSYWVQGSGSVGSSGGNYFGAIGFLEDTINFATDPFNNTSLVWYATSTGGNDASGGWNTSVVSIDNSYTYRFSVWVRRTVVGNGNTYLGLLPYNSSGYNTGVFFRNSTQIYQKTFTADSVTGIFTCNNHGLSSNSQVNFYTSTGTLPGGISSNNIYYVIYIDTNTFRVSSAYGPGSSVTISSNGSGTNYFDGLVEGNPYFQYLDNNSFTQNEWQLWVGHVWPAGTAQGSVHTDTGTYNTSGTKLTTPNDFIFRANHTQAAHRCYLYYATTVGTRQQIFNPRIDKLDGTQPSLNDLLNNRPNKWIDLVNSNVYGTYQGNLTLTTQYGSGFTTPASQTNRYILLPESSLQSLTDGYVWTLEFWVQPLSNLSGRYGPTMTVSGGNDLLMAWGTSDLSIYLSTLTSGTNPTYTINVPMCITLTRNTSTWRLYKNGIFAAQYSYSSADTKTINGWLADQEQDSVKGNFDLNQNVNANWYSFKLYNRILTDGEINNNFNALRGRFGI
jgi:hypothetical protein